MWKCDICGQVLGRLVKIQTINFSFYFSKKQSKCPKVIIKWNVNKLSIPPDGEINLITYKYKDIGITLFNHFHKYQDRYNLTQAQKFFKTYKVLFAACWQDKLEPADVVGYLQGNSTFKQMIKHFYGVNNYQEIQKANNEKQLEQIVRKYNIYNMYD